MISIVYGSPAAGSPNNWAATSADLANDAPNICELALPPPLFTLNGLARYRPLSAISNNWAAIVG
jgi:hypothetical protein